MQNNSRWSIKSLFAVGALALAGTVMAANPVPMSPSKTATGSTSTGKTKAQLEAACKANPKSSDCKELDKQNGHH